MRNIRKRKNVLERIEKIDLENALADHNLWRETNGREGKKADLSYYDISNYYLDDKDFFQVDLVGSNLSNSKLRGCVFYKSDLTDTNLTNANLEDAIFEEVKLINTNFSHANLNKVNILNSNIDLANFEGAEIEKVKIRNYGKKDTPVEEQLFLRDLTPKSDNINIKTEASFEIEELKKELIEREEQLKLAKESEKEKISTATKLIEEKLQKTEAILKKERKAQESTKESIEIAITHLQAPNNYLQTQINIQYLLTCIYAVLSIITIVFLFYYIKNNYAEFKALITPETTFLQWFFYSIPIAVCFSFGLTCINQINKRLRNVIYLYEKRRYVDSISGGLKAVQELSENNKEARARISSVLDEILNNTIILSEKLQKDISQGEKPIENKIPINIKDLKDLLPK